MSFMSKGPSLTEIDLHLLVSQNFWFNEFRFYAIKIFASKKNNTPNNKNSKVFVKVILFS